MYTSTMEFKVPIQSYLMLRNMIKQTSSHTRFQLRTMMYTLELGKHAAEHELKMDEAHTRRFKYKLLHDDVSSMAKFVLS